MDCVFVELPAFEPSRTDYLDDGGFRALQELLIARPDAGALIPGTGGLRKLRFGDTRRGEGKRGGLRMIYFWWEPGRQVWLFTLYGKDETSDLSGRQRAVLRAAIKAELEARRIR